MSDKSFPHRAYTVLAAVSNRYSVLIGRFPRVTHPCATLHETEVSLPVRLACVRHAASVRSEPGSNSQVCVTHLSVTGRNPARPTSKSFKEPIPALSNVMDTNEHASPCGKRGVFHGCGVGFRLPVTATLSFADGAPSPTCPFIKNQRFQRAAKNKRRTVSDPRPDDRGTACPTMLATAGGAFPVGRLRCGERAYMGGSGFGQAPF